jgi:hypothetical protein
MSVAKIVGVALIVVAALGLAFGGFGASGSQEVRVGDIAMTVTERRTLAVPMWVTISALVLGGALLLAPAKRG